MVYMIGNDSSMSIPWSIPCPILSTSTSNSANGCPAVEQHGSLGSTPVVQERSQDERKNRLQGYVVPSALEDTEKAIFRNGYWYNVSTLDVSADESTKTKSWIRSQVNALRTNKHTSYNIQGHTVPKDIHSIVTEERKKLDASQPKKDVLAVLYNDAWYTVVADHNKVKKIVRAGNKIETYIEKWVQEQCLNADKASSKSEGRDASTASFEVLNQKDVASSLDKVKAIDLGG